MLAKTFSCDGVSAVITGASAGLGVEFARQLAPRARRLVLVARREPELLLVRENLLRLHPKLEVIVCPADVSTREGRQLILAKIRESQSAINLLVNNAGLGDYGPFETADTARTQLQIDVNITGLVQLTHDMLPILRQHEPAGILNVSSLAGTLPLPSMAIYAATKAFVTSFSEALRIELLDAGIRVSAVCPGPTPTSFGQTARREEGHDTDRSGQGFLRQPNDRVVADGLAALERGAATIYPGWGVAISATLFRLLPRWLMRVFLTRRFRAAH